MRRAALLVIMLGACSKGPSDERRPLDQARQDRRCAVQVASFQPPSGVIASERVAIAVAHQYLRDAYPQDDRIGPLTASLSDGVWHLKAHLPDGSVGGVAEIALCQSNGRVLSISHGK